MSNSGGWLGQVEECSERHSIAFKKQTSSWPSKIGKAMVQTEEASQCSTVSFQVRRRVRGRTRRSLDKDTGRGWRRKDTGST